MDQQANQPNLPDAVNQGINFSGIIPVMLGVDSNGNVVDGRQIPRINSMINIFRGGIRDGGAVDEFLSDVINDALIGRGIPIGKKQASDKAIEELKELDVNDLPEGDRMCTICYDAYTTKDHPNDKEKSETTDAKGEKAVAEKREFDDPVILFPRNASASNHLVFDVNAKKKEQEEKEGKEKEADHIPVKMSICDHIFGKSCIIEWLKTNTSCPLCRKNVEAAQTPPTEPRTSTDMTSNGSIRRFQQITEVLIPVNWSGRDLIITDPDIGFPDTTRFQRRNNFGRNPSDSPQFERRTEIGFEFRSPRNQNDPNNGANTNTNANVGQFPPANNVPGAFPVNPVPATMGFAPIRFPSSQNINPSNLFNESTDEAINQGIANFRNNPRNQNNGSNGNMGLSSSVPGQYPLPRANTSNESPSVLPSTTNILSEGQNFISANPSYNRGNVNGNYVEMNPVEPNSALNEMQRVSSRTGGPARSIPRNAPSSSHPYSRPSSSSSEE